MQIEAGKYYKTRDGRVVGPMKKWGDYYAADLDGADRLWWENGDHGASAVINVPERDLIVLAYPETGTLQEIGAKAGDVVEWDGHINHTIHDIQDGKYHISETNDNSGYKFWWSVSPSDQNWRIISRASEAKPSPVREVTRKEIVAGVYGDVEVSDHGEVRVAWMDGEAQLTAAIATLTEIRDAMVQE